MINAKYCQEYQINFLRRKYKKVEETVYSQRTCYISTFTNIFLIACYLQTSSYYCERSYDTSGYFDGYGSILYLWMHFLSPSY